MRVLLTAAMAGLLTSPAMAQSAPRPDQLKFRAIYKELVEINTTDSAGSCTEARFVNVSAPTSIS